MAEELLFGVDVQGAEKVAELSKNAAIAKQELAALQKEAASLQKELNKLTQGSEEYNNVLAQIAQKQIEVTNAKMKNIQATQALNTTVKQLTSSTYGLTQAEIEAQASFQALITSLYAYQNSASKSDEATIQMINAFEAYTGAAGKAAAANTQLGGAVNSNDPKLKNNKNLLLQFNQILRETPNFAIDARIGIMSLSNNLPMLGDAIAAARAQGMTFMQTMKLLGTSLLGLQGAFLAITLIMTAFSNPKFVEWFKSMFSATKDLTNATYELVDANKELYGSFNTNINAYGKAIEQTNYLKTAIEAAQKGFIDTKDALKLYNDSLGENFGKVNDLSGAMDLLTKKSDAYIEVMLKLSTAQTFLDAAKETRVEMEKTTFAIEQMTNELGRGNREAIKQLNKSDLEQIFKGNEDGLKKFTEKQEEFKNKRIAIEKEYSDYQKRTLTEGQEAQAKSLGVYEGYLKAKVVTDEQYKNERDKQLGQVLFEESKYYMEILDNAKKYTNDSKEELDKRFKALLEKSKTYYNLAYLDAKNNGIDLFKNEKETTDKINEYSRANKFTPKVVELTEFEKQLGQILNATVKFTDEQKVLIKKAEEYTLGTISNFRIFYSMYRMEVINFNLELDKARLEDLKKQKEVDQEKLDELNMLIQIQRDLYNLDLNDTQNNLREKEKALNEDYIKQAEYENKIAKLKKDFGEAKTNADREAINKQIESTDLLLKDTERRISGNEGSIKGYKDELKALEARRKEIEKNVETGKDVADKLAEIDAQIADTTLNIVEGQKNKIQESLATFGEFADAFGELFSAIADSYQTNMDITNQNYDLEKKRIEESNASEKSKADQLKQLEVDRYNALKKDFERSKKAREAEALINMASGIVSIWAHSADLGPIAGPIVAGIQTAALLLTTKNNIKKIRAEKLEAPSSASNSSVTPTNTAAIPNQTNLTSPQQNLNQANLPTINQKVLVSDINDVQNKVAVRDSNRNI